MSKISGYGISVDLPSGWDGIIFKHPEDPTEPGMPMPIVHLGNFALPQDTSNYGTMCIRAMDDTNIFIALVEFMPVSVARFPAGSVPTSVDPGRFDAHGLHVNLQGLGGFQYFFSYNQRAFCLYAVMGFPPSRGGVNELVTVLRSFVIGPPPSNVAPTPAPVPTAAS